jgi:hypothetical protein
VPILVPIGTEMEVGGLEPAEVDQPNVNSKMKKKKKRRRRRR